MTVFSLIDCVPPDHGRPFSAFNPARITIHRIGGTDEVGHEFEAIRSWFESPAWKLSEHIPYHAVVDKVFIAGRFEAVVCQTLPWRAVGAHAFPNSTSIGIALVVGPDFRATRGQEDAAIWLGKRLVGEMPTIREVVGHDEMRRRQGQPVKGCPGSGIDLERIATGIMG